MRFIRKEDETKVHIWTPALAAREDMVECDKNGKALKDRKAPFEQDEEPAPSFLDKKLEAVETGQPVEPAKTVQPAEPALKLVPTPKPADHVSPLPDAPGKPGRPPKKGLDAIPNDITIGGVAA